jgi:hypothetical protein
VSQSQAAGQARSPELRLPRLLWAWPLLGLALVTLIGVLMGPVGVVLATVVVVPALLLYLEKDVLSPELRLVAVLVPLFLSGALLTAYFFGWAPLQRPLTRTHGGHAAAVADSPPPRAAAVTAAELIKGGLAQGRLRGAVLDGLTLDQADLHGLDASGASLKKTKLRDADLRDLVLRGADLEGADLRGACLDRADLSGTRIAGIKIDQAHLAGAVLPPIGRTAWKRWKPLTASSCPRS